MQGYRVKQVIVLRTKFPDGKGGFLTPPLGKFCAQTAHASSKVFFDRHDPEISCVLPLDPYAFWEEPPSTVLKIPLTPDMEEWVTGEDYAKIVLAVDTEEDLKTLHQQAKAAGLPTALITDLGYTVFDGVPTVTAVAIGPAKTEAVDAITKYGTIKTRLA